MLMALKSLDNREQNKRTIMYGLIMLKKGMISTLSPSWETYVITRVSLRNDN